MPSFVLASTIAALYAADVPLPIEMTALVMVGLILRVYLGRESKQQSELAKRLDAIEAEADEQRHIKHMVLNRLAGITGTLALVKAAAERCTCGATAPVLPLIERLLAREEENKP